MYTQPTELRLSISTRQAVYDKLKNIETKTAREIVRYMADDRN